MTPPPASPTIETEDPTARDEVLGFRVDRVTMEEAVDRCLSYLEGDRRPRLVVTLNAAIVAMAERDERLRAALRAGDLILADGLSVVWAARLSGAGLRHRVAGVDLMERLAHRADLKGLRLYFLGARPEVVRKVVARVESEHPGAVVAGFRDGFFDESGTVGVIEEIRRSRADVLFVAMHTPFKEIWCSEHLEELGVPVVLPVGGAFDVYSGEIPRAPLWMQKAGLEWSWRLMMEPRQKWRRYLFLNSAFVWLCLRSAFLNATARTRGLPGASYKAESGRRR